MASRRLVKLLRASDLNASSAAPAVVAYPIGWACQTLLLHQAMLAKRQTERRILHDHFILLEHAPVYTLGRGADLDHLTSLHLSDEVKHCLTGRGEDTARLSPPSRQVLDALVQSLENKETTLSSAVSFLLQSTATTPVLAPNQIPIYRVERGGEVTYHGPGQIIGYPLLDLSHYKQDLHWFLRQIEQVIIDTLRVDFGLDADRDAEHTGVWIGDRKIAAIGIAASRWITYHGFSVNVTPDLTHFDSIRPCGIQGRGVTSMEKELLGTSTEVSMALVTERLLHHFARTFSVDLKDDGL